MIKSFCLVVDVAQLDLAVIVIVTWSWYLNMR